MKFWMCLILLLVAISCNNQQAKRDSKVQDHGNELDTAALSFYNWYLEAIKSGSYGADIKTENGRMFLDTQTYFNSLRELGTISDTFIENERDRLDNCAKAISGIEYSGLDTLEEFGLSEPCDFSYYYWLQLQETVDGFDIITRVVNGDKAKFKLRAFWNNGEKKDYWKRPFYILLEEHGKWQILDIQFSEEP